MFYYPGFFKTFLTKSIHQTFLWWLFVLFEQPLWGNTSKALEDKDPNKKSGQKKAFRNGSITEATHWKNGILQASIYWRSVNQHLFFDNRVLIEMARLSLKSLSKLSTQQYCSLCIDHLHGLGQRHSLDPWKQL